MIVTRLSLRNYRVYEEPIDLELPPGLIGVYGPNGAGKSYLVEAIRWTLFGHARTSKDEVRTAGVGSDCVTEVDFEHEGHSYVVRRVVTGAASAVRAEAESDGSLVAEGSRDVARYVHSVLGMDDDAFRSSVFAEQKQLAAFSVRRPAERRDLVLGLLGVTPLDSARDEARRDARDAREQVERLRLLLADRAALEEDRRRAESLLASGSQARQAREQEAAAATEALEAVERRAKELAEARREWDRLVEEGRRSRSDLDERRQRVRRLEVERKELEEQRERVAKLEVVAGAGPGDERLRLLGEAEAAAGALAKLPATPEPAPAGPELAAPVREAARLASLRVVEVETLLAAAVGGREKAEQELSKSSGLSVEAECPLCGQALGESFVSVTAHRERELEQARQAEEILLRERAGARAAAAGADSAAREAVAQEERSLALRRQWELADGARQAAGRRLEDAVRELGHVPAQGERAAAVAEAESARVAATEAARIRGRLDRGPALERELVAERGAVGDLELRVERLREEVRALRFRPEDGVVAEGVLGVARAAARSASGRARDALGAESAAREALAAVAGREAQAEEQRQRLRDQEEEARHLGRAADLLSAFRNSVVATIGPRLAVQAAELFAELTDHEYDRLEVDPDTYEIRIRDQGSSYGMGRYSGSETDLANLALRVAISEQVRFQSGGAVGLLVLDEVFGPLDDDRRERMLAALERLRSRFRQVLVVTHADDIKERLPQAIEVRKLPGRRATAQLLP
ncbi:MAG: AAA family ATPase [Acidimicrobiales bacterium]